MVIFLLYAFICVYILHGVMSYSMLPNKSVFHNTSRLTAMNMKRQGVFMLHRQATATTSPTLWPLFRHNTGVKTIPHWHTGTPKSNCQRHPGTVKMTVGGGKWMLSHGS